MDLEINTPIEFDSISCDSLTLIKKIIKNQGALTCRDFSLSYGTPQYIP